MAITPGGRVGDASPLGKPGGPRGLTDYIREVAHALMRKYGWDESHAIAVARNAQKKWVAKSKNPAVKAGAAASLAQQAVLDHRKRGKRDLSNRGNGDIELAYVGFNKLTAQLAAKGAKDPSGLAAAIGRKKYGKRKFAKAAASGVALGKKKK